MNKLFLVNYSYLNKNLFNFYKFFFYRFIFSRFIYFFLIILILKNDLLYLKLSNYFSFFYKKEIITILRSPHVNKRSSEQFGSNLIAKKFFFETPINFLYKFSILSSLGHSWYNLNFRDCELYCCTFSNFFFVRNFKFFRHNSSKKYFSTKVEENSELTLPVKRKRGRPRKGEVKSKFSSSNMSKVINFYDIQVNSFKKVVEDDFYVTLTTETVSNTNKGVKNVSNTLALKEMSERERIINNNNLQSLHSFDEILETNFLKNKNSNKKNDPVLLSPPASKNFDEKFKDNLNSALLLLFGNLENFSFETEKEIFGKESLDDSENVGNKIIIFRRFLFKMVFFFTKNDIPQEDQQRFFEEIFAGLLEFKITKYNKIFMGYNGYIKIPEHLIEMRGVKNYKIIFKKIFFVRNLLNYKTLILFHINTCKSFSFKKEGCCFYNGFFIFVSKRSLLKTVEQNKKYDDLLKHYTYNVIQNHKITEFYKISDFESSKFLCLLYLKKYSKHKNLYILVLRNWKIFLNFSSYYLYIKFYAGYPIFKNSITYYSQCRDNLLFRIFNQNLILLKTNLLEVFWLSHFRNKIDYPIFESKYNMLKNHISDTDNFLYTKKICLLIELFRVLHDYSLARGRNRFKHPFNYWLQISNKCKKKLIFLYTNQLLSLDFILNFLCSGCRTIEPFLNNSFIDNPLTEFYYSIDVDQDLNYMFSRDKLFNSMWFNLPAAKKQYYEELFNNHVFSSRFLKSFLEAGGKQIRYFIIYGYYSITEPHKWKLKTSLKFLELNTKRFADFLKITNDKDLKTIHFDNVYLSLNFLRQAYFNIFNGDSDSDSSEIEILDKSKQLLYEDNVNIENTTYIVGEKEFEYPIYNDMSEDLDDSDASRDNIHYKFTYPIEKDFKCFDKELVEAISKRKNKVITEQFKLI
jgi:hypothetical protein